MFFLELGQEDLEQLIKKQFDMQEVMEKEATRVPEIERKTAIEDISRALDLMEEAAQGPLLAGSKLSLADAVAYPSIALCSLTLPDHFGWEPWTEESMFYRRPRLHAWYELISYEKACREAEKQIRAKLEEVADLAKIAVDVPTSKLRDFPKHAM